MICIIPARGGSKRIPRKNIKRFRGKPIISYPIKTAKAAGWHTYVSSEDAEIQKIAHRYKAVVWARDPELAGDDVSTEAVLYDILQYFGDKVACLMYPTSVFARREWLLTAKAMLVDCDLVHSITQYSYPIQRALKVDGEHVSFVNVDKRNSQDIEPRYHDAAQFYVFNTAAFKRAYLEGRDLLELRAKYIELPNSEVQDIDTPEDWKEAVRKYRGRGI